MLKRVVIIIFVMIAICLTNKVLATDSLEIVILEDQIKEGDIFDVSVQVHDLPVAATTLQIFFDSNKVEYVAGPENSNPLQNMILYTWVDENAGDTKITEGEIAKFSFKAKTTREQCFCSSRDIL